jgi:8-amino-7-oxononanoate synthase
MPALVDVARAQVELAARQSLARTLKQTQRLGGARVRRGENEFVSFSCNDYLGLAHHPRVSAAAR